MATNTVKPDADSNCNWSGLTCDPFQHDCVDEYPAGLDGNRVLATDLDGTGLLEVFGMSTFDGIEDNSITQIIVYTYGWATAGYRPSIDVSFDNGVSWEGSQQCPLGDQPNNEITNTWAGLSYSKADLDDLLIKYVSNTPDKTTANSIDRVYAIITYTVAAANWGHVFLGVAAANIAEVNGVPIANIASIKGVAI